MREYYLKQGLLKKIHDDATQYTDIPEGPMELDRFFSGKPAFLTISDEENTYRLRKLVLNPTDLRNVLEYSSPEEPSEIIMLKIAIFDVATVLKML